ncbi:hypothetical protein [Planctomyces sp. SH-PL62]|uniref:hypothetical protein n=1 Tax=Planctomyces sp. SH-PL62 TaxID=1636152 RepID=UPI00078CDCAD|nr:hypothetical protein [Planctomyces sp. SH-PL62]AMV37756.1 hypothetical protein VT85_09990 [Planctomyces sp. SH-PL62]
MASYDPDFRAVDPDKSFPGYDPEPRRRGCLFYGCVVVVVLSVLLMLALALGAFLAYRTAIRYRDLYTATAPVELPKLGLTEADRERAVARMTAFRDAVEAGEDVMPLVLTSDDLNALIQESPRLKDRIYLTLEGDKIRAKVSFPLAEIQDLSFTRGRYLNGEADLKAVVKDGVLSLEFDSMVADGKELPEVVCDTLSQSDIILDDDDDSNDTDEERRVRSFIRRIASLEVEDGQMIVTPESGDKKPEPEPKPGEDEPEDQGEPGAGPIPEPPSPPPPPPAP